MNLAAKLTDLLKNPEASIAKTVSAEAQGNRARVDFADSDRYSIALQTLTVGCDSRIESDTQPFLSAKAAALARELSYLEEPLAVWELDGSTGIAQLRSTPPQREGESISYWEVELHTSATPFATLARYCWSPGLAERERLDYPATFALVGRMVGSVVAALGK